MNKGTIIGSIIVIILIVFGIWYFASSNTNSTYVTQQTSPTTSAPTTGTTAPSNTFHSIFAQSGNHQCTYESVGGSSVKSSSVVDIADGEMRGEFRTTTSTTTTANLMIYNGGLLYTWKEGATVGTKTSIKTLADLPDIIPGNLNSAAIFGVTSNNSVSWDCHDWAKDPTLFVIPTYVKFTAAF